MLAKEQRITQGTDFSLVMRSGVRIGRRNVVLYALASPDGSKTGIIVSKAVGNAVKRNLVKRRLREIVRADIGDRSVRIVIRALPASATASFLELRDDVTSALARIDQKLAERHLQQGAKERR